MNRNQFNTIKNILLFFLVVLIFTLMKELSNILIPFVMALLVVVLFQPLVMFLKSKRFPNFIIVPIIGLITLLFIYGVYSVISEAYSDLLDNKDYLISRLTVNLNRVVGLINNNFGTSYAENMSIRDFIDTLDANFINKAATNFAGALGSFTGSFVIFSVYYIFLLAGISNYKNYLNFVSGEIENGDILSNYEAVQKAIYSYIIIKSVISIITGLLVYIICLAFGIEFALLWGFTAFALNYIPSLGSIAGSLPPVIMAFIQFDSLNKVFFVFFLVGLSQFIMGNIFEPRMLGQRLRLNTPTVIFGLVFFGFIWGIPGMVVCIPLLVMIKLIFEQFPSLRVVARVMGSPGRK